MITSNWTYEEFLTFVLLYAASIDSIISEEEIDLIKGKVGDSTYERVQKIFHQVPDYECIQVILSYEDQYFPTKEKQETLIRQMQEIFLSDERYSVMEQNLIMIFRKLL